MSFSFQNQGTSTYLVYEIQKNDTIDSMSLGMLTNNKIPGLASTIFTQMDEVKYIKYNVSAKVSAKQLFTGSVNKKRLLGVFRGIVDAMLSSEDYMIDPNTIILDLDYIFADVSTCETILVCLPIERKPGETVNLGMFFKNIIFSTQYDQTENCDHVAKIINFLNSNPNFVLKDFKNLIDTIDNVKSIPNEVYQKSNTVDTVPQVGQPYVSNNFSQSNNAAGTQITADVKPVNNTQQNMNSQSKVQNNSGVNKQDYVMPNVGQTVNNGMNEKPKPQKTVTLGTLLTHYSKENKQLYKEQRAAKKAQKQGQSASAVNNNQSEKNDSNKGFAIPGQPLSMTSAAPMNNQNTNFQNNNFAKATKTVPQAVSQNNNFVAPYNSSNSKSKASSFVPMYSSQPVSVSVTNDNTMSKNVSNMTTANVSSQVFMEQSKALNIGETTVLGAGTIGETTVLNSSQSAQNPYLLRIKTNEKVFINTMVFRIGKEKSYVDYFICDNTAISRSHANIITKEGKYYIIDTNSTNHTFVNGKMIQSNVETQLEHGTKICLANEEFEFKFY